jgi:hypothetical protein
MSGIKPDRFPAQAPTGLYVKSDSALRLRADRVRRIVARMRKEMPWLTPADTPAMKGWAELEILSATVFAWLTRLNILNGQGEPRRLLSEHRALKLAQLAYERELGMTPPCPLVAGDKSTGAEQPSTPGGGRQNRSSASRESLLTLSVYGSGARRLLDPTARNPPPLQLPGWCFPAPDLPRCH